jgi:HSP20 family protein
MALELWRGKRGLMRSPWRELAEMEHEMEDMFAPFFRGFPWRARPERTWRWAPAVDMVERNGEIVLRADLPGLAEKDVAVSVQDGMLTIRGERKEEHEEKEESYYYCERSLGAFVRSVPLPPGVDADKIKATFKNGVLEVHVPKSKESAAKTIEIKAE